MGNIVKIQNQEVMVKEYKGQRVVTFKDIDSVHERAEGTARKRFSDNKERFVENEDYFKVSASEIRTTRLFDIPDKATSDYILVTEQGYLMLVKSFTDDLAWKVQRELVKSYFSPQGIMQINNLSPELQAIIMHDKKIQKIENRMDKLEYDIPLYGSEADELCNHVKRKGVQMLGGKDSNSYKDNKIRSAVYTDIYNQIKREFGLYDDKGRYKSYKALKRKYIYDAHEVVDAYELPYILAEQVRDCNAQMSMEVA